MKTLQIGDKVVQRPTCGDHEQPVKVGRVVYIHPEKRFYTLEFEFESRYGYGTFRESYIWHPDR